MGKVLVIGCGGVAQVAIQKCAQNDAVFDEICIASRTVSKCDDLKKKIEAEGKSRSKITTAKVNADSVDEVIALIKSVKPDVVLNLALPYQDLTIMDACLACGVHYVDSANYEPEDTEDPTMRSAARSRALPHTLTTPGSGHIRRNSRMQVSPQSWAPVLIRA